MQNIESNSSNTFNCYLCGNTFNRTGFCQHFNEDEMDDEGEVSFCDNCADKVMNKASEEKVTGLSNKFFNCK